MIDVPPIDSPTTDTRASSAAICVCLVTVRAILTDKAFWSVESNGKRTRRVQPCLGVAWDRLTEDEDTKDAAFVALAEHARGMGYSTVTDVEWTKGTVGIVALIDTVVGEIEAGDSPS